MLGSLISAGLSLIGGRKAEKKADQRDAVNYQRQKEFAQRGIQWKVNDAKKAGVHPLYALGAGTTSYAPQQVGNGGNGLHSAGQDIGRAINAVTGAGGRDRAYTAAVQKLNLRRMELENNLLASKIATTNQTQIPPAPAGENFLVQGQTGAGLINERPMKKEKGLPGYEHQEPAPITEYGYLKTPRGYAVVQSRDAKDRLEEDLPGSVGWHWRNRVKPMFGSPKPPYKAPPMHKWRFDPISGEYILVPPKFRRKKSRSRWPRYH